MTRLLAAVAAPLVVVAVGGSPTMVDPDDQAAAEAAVAVFNTRLTEAGWSSTGPFTQTAPEDDAESEFGACLNGFELYLDYTEMHIDGETGRAFSHNFELVSSEPEPTDSMGDYGYAGAVVLTAVDPGVELLDAFVEQLGAEQTVACITGQAAFESMAEEVAITNEADVGVGDASARLDFTVTMSLEGTELTTSATFAAARVERTLVVVAAGGSGSAQAALDPIAELAAMVDTFD